MRDLDKRGLMTGDFLVVSGDVVSNFPLGNALAKHRSRREKDKNAIMTMVLRQAGTEHRSKSTGRKPVFVIDPEAERCVHYEESGHQKNENRYIKLDPALLTAHGQLEVRGDLIDCYIDICTPDVLSLWSDNFDYQSVRQSFLSEVLKDHELTGKTIHTHVVTDHYAGRVQSLRAYAAITKDVMSRWTYPFCPDSNLMKGQTYRSKRGRVYEEDGVKLARTSVVEGRNIFGQDTSLAHGCVVAGSVLGRRCQIGDNVIVRGSYLWNDVTVGNGSLIEQAIVADGVSIGKDCKIEPGALISFGARIEDNTVVSGTSKITRETQTTPNRFSADAKDGKGGVFHSYRTDIEEDDSDSSSVGSSHLVYQIPSASASHSSISTLASEEAEHGTILTGSRRSSIHSDPSEDSSKQRDFHLEATASILDGLLKGDLSENILLELNSYRMSVNANQHQVRRAVVAALMRRITGLVAGGETSDSALRSPQEAVKEVFSKHQTLLERNIFDKSNDQKVDQVDFLWIVQQEAVSRPKGGNMMLFVAKEAYDLEIIEEDGVLQWWEDARSKTVELAGVRDLMEPFIVFLREADEEESEESSGDGA